MQCKYSLFEFSRNDATFIQTGAHHCLGTAGSLEFSKCVFRCLSIFFRFLRPLCGSFRRSLQNRVFYCGVNAVRTTAQVHLKGFLPIVDNLLRCFISKSII